MILIRWIKRQYYTYALFRAYENGKIRSFIKTTMLFHDRVHLNPRIW